MRIKVISLLSIRVHIEKDAVGYGTRHYIHQDSAVQCTESLLLNHSRQSVSDSAVFRNGVVLSLIASYSILLDTECNI